MLSHTERNGRASLPFVDRTAYADVRRVHRNTQPRSRGAFFAPARFPALALLPYPELTSYTSRGRASVRTATQNATRRERFGGAQCCCRARVRPIPPSPRGATPASRSLKSKKVRTPPARFSPLRAGGGAQPRLPSRIDPQSCSARTRPRTRTSRPSLKNLTTRAGSSAETTTANWPIGSIGHRLNVRKCTPACICKVLGATGRPLPKSPHQPLRPRG